jgi:hypothetical protein
MLEKVMIVKQRESTGTIKYYYLGVIANQMLQRHVLPVIGVITGVYSDSITIRKRRGREEIVNTNNKHQQSIKEGKIIKESFEK